MMNKGLRVAATVVVLGAAFFAGHTSYGVTSEFAHTDIVNTADLCGEGQFIGGCKTCLECNEFEYAAGGCSYFKDTFCTLCNPIDKCPQDNTRCDEKDDEICLECDAGYWDVDCKPCAVCDPGYFESEKCTQESNSVCTKCNEGGKNQYLSTACTYFSDSEWSDCTTCAIGTFTDVSCRTSEAVEGKEGEFPASVYTLQPDTTCTACTEPSVMPGTYVTKMCTLSNDTEFTDCTPCPCEDAHDSCQFETIGCDAGGIQSIGEDTVCQDCSQKKENEWEAFPCGGTSDAMFEECSTCMDGEYSLSECSAGADMVCPDCPADGTLENCKAGAVRCTTAEDSECEDCQGGYSGSHCRYHKYNGACGTTTSRSRMARRDPVYDGSTDEEFIEFCRELCNEFPDCMAFEVEDGGRDLLESGPNSFADSRSEATTCYFKAAYSQEICTPMQDRCDGRTKSRFRSVDPTFDCYSNVERQNVGFITYFPSVALPYEPCDNKKEGAACTLCAPNNSSCVEEPAGLKMCIHESCVAALLESPRAAEEQRIGGALLESPRAAEEPRIGEDQ